MKRFKFYEWSPVAFRMVHDHVEVYRCDEEASTAYGIYGVYCEIERRTWNPCRHEVRKPGWSLALYNYEECKLLREHLGDAHEKEDAIALVDELNRLNSL